MSDHAVAATSIPLIREGTEGTSHDTRALYAVTGSPLATVHEAPPVLVRLTTKAMRTAPRASAGELVAVLSEAGRLFAKANLAGEAPEEYSRLQALASGVPIDVARRTMARLSEDCALLPDVVEAQRPAGASGAPAHWVRRGTVLGVVAPSNHPATHLGWLKAIALGYGVALRPGARDPVTPLRLARALLEAGLPSSLLSLLPGSHAASETLVASADLALVYGGDATVADLRGSNRVLANGPGRSKILVDGPVDDDLLDYLVNEIAEDGGVRCTNATAVLTSGDHRALAGALAERLASLPVLPATDSDAVLPLRPVTEAQGLRASLVAAAEGVPDLMEQYHPGDPIPLVDGHAAAMRPAVMCVDHSSHPGLRTELPFPCVWVAPWRASEGIAPMRDSLALTLLNADAALVADALNTPSIRTVVHGAVPGWWRNPYLPHEGYIGQFLREVRGYATPVREKI